MNNYINHRKDKKITIIGIESIEDENGFYKKKEIEVYKNIWAYYRHISGKEIFYAATVNTKVEVIFEINYKKDIDTSMKILYNDEKYYISQIDDYEGKKTGLKIYAYKIG